MPYASPMASKLTPSGHLLIRVREVLTELLYLEGVSEAAVGSADSYWRGATVDVLLDELQDILPPVASHEVLEFCRKEYPLLYRTLPRRITDAHATFFRAQLGSLLQATSSNSQDDCAGGTSMITRPGPKSGGVFMAAQNSCADRAPA